MDKEDVKCVYITEYYLVIKKNEILPFAMTWMGLESFMLNEMSQIEERQTQYDFTYV